MSGDIHFGVDITRDNLDGFMKAIEELRAQAVYAGFPEDKDEPREDSAGNTTPITNAALGYIHDKGMPEQNIPARPFMVPGVESVQEQVVSGMEAIGVSALDGDSQAVEAGFNAVGLTAQNGIRRKIVEGPFTPLAESTLRARARMGGSVAKAATRELDSRAAGNAPGVEDARPLNLTGQMRNAVTYVVRKEE